MFDKETYNGYKNIYTKMLHGDETKDAIYGTLKEESVPPAKRVAEVAKMITQQANQVAKRNNISPDVETVIGSSLYLASDIMDIAKQGGFFEVSPETSQELIEASSKATFQQSIRDKVLDPVELQKVLNENMPENLGKMGLSQEGVPNEADETVAMEQYAVQREGAQAQKAQEEAERTPAQAMQGRQDARSASVASRQEAQNGIS